MHSRKTLPLLFGGLAVLIFIVLFLVFLGFGRRKEPALSMAPAEEERLIIYTSHKEEVWQPLVREFEERTGIWTEVVQGGTNELLERLAAEKDAPVCDVMFGGGAESLSSMAELFAPCEGTELSADAAALDPRYLSPSGLWTPFSSLPLVLIYNPQLLREGEITGWESLFEERFRGRIAFAAPSVSGSCFTALSTILCVRGWENREKTLIDFAAAIDGKELAGSGDIITQVAKGQMLVGITLEETALQHQRSGASIAIVYPEEGTSCVPDGTALIQGAPHPDNARRFLSFTVSRDVQSYITEHFLRRSVRTDVPAGAGMLPAGDLRALNYSIEEVSSERGRILTAWAFYAEGNREDLIPYNEEEEARP